MCIYISINKSKSIFFYHIKMSIKIIKIEIKVYYLFKRFDWYLCLSGAFKGDEELEFDYPSYILDFNKKMKGRGIFIFRKFV